MKNTLFALVAASLLIAGCSKQELIENAPDGVSSVATPTNSNGRVGDPSRNPSIWFNPGTSRVHVQLNGNTRPPLLEMQIVHQRDGAIEDPNDFVDEDGDGNPDPIVTDLTLARQGNSKNYQSEDQFVFGTETYFSLVNVTLDWNAVDDTPQEESHLEMQLFLYPSGRTVEQDPKVVKVRGNRWTFDDNVGQDESYRLAVILADDPAQEVAQLKFVPNPVYPNPDDPTCVIYPEPSYFEKTHENQNLGLSRWTGGTWSGTGTTTVSGTLYLLDNGGTPITTFSWGTVLD